MKIVQAMLAKGFGGAERYFVDLTNYLAESGHEVLVIAHRDFKQIQQIKTLDNLNIKTFNVLGWWDVRSRLSIQKEIQAFAPDVIHTHLARATYLCGHASKNLNIPLVVKTHNYIDLKYYKNVSCFIPTTEDQKNYLMEKGIAADRINVIPNFSSLIAIEPQEHYSCADVPVFYTIGRMVKKKGFDDLINAFAKLVEDGTRARLVIAGDGPEKNTLEALVDSHGLKQQVSFAGWIDNVEEFIEDKDIFVLPSSDEPFGIVLLEAMAMGKPIISTRADGPLAILNDKTALLVDIGAVDQMTKAMKTLLDDKNLAARLCSQASADYQQHYSLKAVAPRIINLYQSF